MIAATGAPADLVKSEPCHRGLETVRVCLSRRDMPWQEHHGPVPDETVGVQENNQEMTRKHRINDAHLD